MSCDAIGITIDTIHEYYTLILMFTMATECRYVCIKNIAVLEFKDSLFNCRKLFT